MVELYFSTVFPNCISQLYFSTCRGGSYPGYRGCCSICPLCLCIFNCISQLYVPTVFLNCFSTEFLNCFPTVFLDCISQFCISQLAEEDPILDIGAAVPSVPCVSVFSIVFLNCMSQLYFSTVSQLNFSTVSQLYFSIVFLSSVFLNLRRRILSWISGLLFHLSLVSVLAAANVSLPSQLSLSRVPEEETIQRGDNIQGTETEQEQSVSWYWRVF